MADKTSLREGEYVDPSLRSAVSNIANSALAIESDPDIAIQKGMLKIEKPPEYSYGTPLNEAVMKRARDKFYDPAISEGLQKLRHVSNQAANLQNASNNVMQIYKLDKQAEAITRERKAAEDAQRAAVIGSVLGLGGAVAGFALAGPIGGMAGAQAGKVAAPQPSGGTGYLGANTKF